MSISLTASASNDPQGNKWIAVVAIKVVDASGTPRPSVQVRGTWSESSSCSNTTGQECGSCITQSGGQCPVSLEALTNGRRSVTYTVTSVTGCP